MLNEVTTLIRQGYPAEVVSAIDLKEEATQEAFRRLGLVERTRYLTFDYLYPYAPTLTYTPEEVEERVLQLLTSKNSLISAYEKGAFLEVLSELEQEREMILRGVLEVFNVIALMRRVGINHIHCPFAEDNVKLAYIINRVMHTPYTFKMHAYDIFSQPVDGYNCMPWLLKKWLRSPIIIVTISTRPLIFPRNISRSFTMESMSMKSSRSATMCATLLRSFPSPDWLRKKGSVTWSGPVDGSGNAAL